MLWAAAISQTNTVGLNENLATEILLFSYLNKMCPGLVTLECVVLPLPFQVNQTAVYIPPALKNGLYPFSILPFATSCTMGLNA